MAQSEAGKNCRSQTSSFHYAHIGSQGLPYEVWQIVFSQLQASDLCRASQVCKAWNNLILALDSSHWRELYHQSSEWKTPFWPLQPDVRPVSWKHALKDHVLATRFWYQGNFQVDPTQCLAGFWRSKGSYWHRKTIIVGKESQYDTLKSALCVANEYDRIIVKPGIYDEQFEMSSKIPLELVGQGELGSVILVMCVEQTSITGRLCNLVIRAPWFTSYALKVTAGYIQVDNCIVENGLVLIQNPGTCHFKFCTFRDANVIFQHVNASLIENSEFSQCDLAAVSVEGFPKDEINWAHGHMIELTAITKDSICNNVGHESRSRSTFSLPTKSSTSQECADVLSRKNLKQQHPGITDNSSITSSTVLHNINNWLDDAVEFGSQLTLTLDDPPVELNSEVTPKDGGTEFLKSVSETKLSVSERTLKKHTHQRNSTKDSAISEIDGYPNLSCRPSSCSLLDCDSDSSSTEIHKTQNSYTLNMTKHFKNPSDPNESKNSKRNLLKLKSVDNLTTNTVRSSKSEGSFKTQSTRSKLHRTAKLTGEVVVNTDSEESVSSRHSETVITESNARSGADVPLCEGAIMLPNSQNAPNNGWQNISSCDETKQVTDVLVHASSSMVFDKEASSSKLKNSPDSVLDHPPNICESAYSAGSNGTKSFLNQHNTYVEALPSDHDPVLPSVSGIQPEHFGVRSGISENYDSIKEIAAGVSNYQPCEAKPDPQEEACDKNQLGVHDDIAQSDGEDDFLLDDLSSEDESSDHEDSSPSSSEFSPSESSLSDQELLLQMSHPRHRTFQLKRRESHPEISNNPNMVDHATQRVDGHGLEALWEDSDILRALDEVQGVVIRNCRMITGKGGVMVSCQGHARIIGCHISNMGYGIRCVQNSRALVLKNEIRHCRTSGIFMRLAASGVIAGNDIHSNKEAGIDVRKNADPIIHGNQIHHGERFGVAVLCSGQGQIRNNDIFSNAEAGIYILYRGNPLVSDNRLMRNQAAGISVNESGLGMIRDNMVSGNLWAGVYVRHGGDPFVQNNVICNGVADGVVIGERGRGTISKNTITGNAGCGVWIMGGECPLLHGNNISNNGDSGIAFVTNAPSVPGPPGRGHDLTGHNSHGHSASSIALQDLFINEDRREAKPHYSQAKVVHNTVCHNSGHGISVESGKDVLVGSNSVYGNSQSGVYVNHPRAVTVFNNHISCNKQTGVTTGILGQTTILSNGIFDNELEAVIGQNELSIKENDIYSNQSAPGISLKGTNQIKVEKNRVYSTKEVIIVEETAHGTICGNELYSDLDKAIVTTSSKVKVTDNKTVKVKSQGPPWKRNDSSSRPTFLEPEDPPIQTPTRYVRSVAKVTVLDGGNCQGVSRTCAIL